MHIYFLCINGIACVVYAVLLALTHAMPVSYIGIIQCAIYFSLFLLLFLSMTIMMFNNHRILSIINNIIFLILTFVAIARLINFEQLLFLSHWYAWIVTVLLGIVRISSNVFGANKEDKKSSALVIMGLTFLFQGLCAGFFTINYIITSVKDAQSLLYEINIAEHIEMHVPVIILAMFAPALYPLAYGFNKPPFAGR